MIRLLFLGFSIMGVYCGSWLIQNQLLLNWDVSYFLHAAKLLLAGGSYTNDFFNPNPPLILLLSIPPLVLSSFFKLSIIAVFRSYVFGLATISLGLCWSLLRLIIGPSNFFLRTAVLLAIAVSFLIVPFYEFGQRDHLFFMLSLPYPLLLAARLQKNSRLGFWLALAIGLFSGLGFLIKPQFFLVFLLLEIYYCLSKRNFLAWLRCEALTVGALSIAYVAVVFLFFSDFIFTVMPFLLRHYYSSVGEPWQAVLFNPIIEVCYFPLLLYVAVNKKHAYSVLVNTLVVALGGYLLACFAQHNYFYYHLLPPFSLAFILSVLLFSIITRSQLNRSEYWRLSILVMALAGILIQTASIIWISIVYTPLGYFGFFSVLFGFILLSSEPRLSAFPLFQWISRFANVILGFTHVILAKARILSGMELIKDSRFREDDRIDGSQDGGAEMKGHQLRCYFFKLATLITVMSIAYSCFYMAQRTAWSDHQFFFTTFILTTLFGLLAPRAFRGIGGNLLLVLLGMLLFAYPVYAGYSIYGRSLAFKDQVLLPLINFVKAQPSPRKVYVFSSRVSFSVPLMHYAQAELTQRFDCMWPVLGFNKESSLTAALDEKTFKNMVLDDFKRYRPTVVMVDMQDPNLKLNTGTGYFDYLAYFKQNAQFRKEWSAYQFLTDVESQRFKMRVFVRK